MDNFIIFTGGPSSGKTTIINCLKKIGYKTTTEVGRRVIKEEVLKESNILPWKDKIAFCDKMTQEEVNNYNLYKKSKELIFFDRSIIDCYAYSVLENILISKKLNFYCEYFKYNTKVFIFPPWEEIYKNDNERKQSFDKAVDTYTNIVKAYEKFGYSLIEVPKVSKEERTKFILNQLII